MTDKAKVLFIGLDSAEPNLLREWADSGEMPILQSLRDESAWGATTAPEGFGNGVLWPSLFTGVNPGKHGRYYYRQIRPGSYTVSEFREDSDFKCEPLWCSLSRAGRRVAVFDMVRAPLTKNINGIQLVDWITHDRSGPTRSWPPELASEVTAKFGTDPMGGTTEVSDRSEADYVYLRNALLDRIKSKTDMSLEYLEQGDWDLFMTVYADPHDIGHQCWHLHDPNYADYDADMARRVGDPIKDICRAIDADMGRILEQAGPDTTVVVFTGPGMGPLYTGNFVMDDILRRLEGRKASTKIERINGIKALCRRFLPRTLREQIKIFGKPTEQAVLSADREDRKYFAVPHNSNAGAIRINVVGREPNGRVQPGAEYDELCDWLTKELMDMVNVENGEPLVEKVVRVGEQFQGDHLDCLPDLLAVWNRPGKISVVGSKTVGEIRQPYIGIRTGDHTPRGLFYVRGPGIEPGELDHPISVMDLSVSLSAMFGVSLPGADGVVVSRLVPDQPVEELAEASN